MPQIYDMGPTASAGFEPANLSTKGQHATPRPPKPLKANIHFFIISRSVILRTRNVAEKRCRENQNTHFFALSLFFSENHSTYEIMWKNIVNPERPRVTLWHMRIACWLP